MAGTVEVKKVKTVTKQTIYLCCNCIQLWLQQTVGGGDNSPIATHTPLKPPQAEG
jgi:hypothetical protein